MKTYTTSNPHGTEATNMDAFQILLYIGILLIITLTMKEIGRLRKEVEQLKNKQN